MPSPTDKPPTETPIRGVPRIPKRKTGTATDMSDVDVDATATQKKVDKGKGRAINPLNEGPTRVHLNFLTLKFTEPTLRSNILCLTSNLSAKQQYKCR